MPKFPIPDGPESWPKKIPARENETLAEWAQRYDERLEKLEEELFGVKKQAIVDRSMLSAQIDQMGPRWPGNSAVVQQTGHRTITLTDETAGAVFDALHEWWTGHGGAHGGSCSVCAKVEPVIEMLRP